MSGRRKRVTENDTKVKDMDKYVTFISNQYGNVSTQFDKIKEIQE